MFGCCEEHLNDIKCMNDKSVSIFYGLILITSSYHGLQIPGLVKIVIANKEKKRKWFPCCFLNILHRHARSNSKNVNRIESDDILSPYLFLPWWKTEMKHERLEINISTFQLALSNSVSGGFFRILYLSASSCKKVFIHTRNSRTIHNTAHTSAND